MKGQLISVSNAKKAIADYKKLLGARGRNVGWAVEEEFNSLWYAAALDEHQGE
jgi:hypothetical protein